MTRLLPFIATTFLLAMLPGVGQALMSRQVLSQGRGGALMTTAGTGAGLVLWSVAAAAGLSAVVLAHAETLTALRYGGGLLLVLLGVRTLARKARPEADAQATPALGRGRLGSFLVGLATNLANPKAGIFAVALLPQFVPHGADPFWATAGLGVVWALVTVTWYVLFTWLVARGQQVLATPRSRRLLELASGGALVAVGLAVASGL